MEEDCKVICRAFQEGKPCLIGRFGTIECEILDGRGSLEVLERNAGVFPIQEAEAWKTLYKQSIYQADILATGWYTPMKEAEQRLLRSWEGKQVALRSLEPYYHKEVYRWTNYLRNKKVCVISSFTQTIEKQIAKGEEKIWPDQQKTLWPEGVEWSFIRTGYAPCLARGNCSWTDIAMEDITSWKEALEYVVREIERINPDVVLVGCGGLGMIIGAEAKKRGKICIVLGGAIQVYFGVKGERWKTHSVLSKFWNEEWVWPSEEETPNGAREVEGACYWAK